MAEQSSLVLSEALLTLVDSGELREGADAYLAAQKVISDGEAALSTEEGGFGEKKSNPGSATNSPADGRWPSFG